jgi:F-box-like
MALRFRRGFPEELLLHIIGSVENPNTLAALSLVSHYFHKITEPYLYSTVVQDEWTGIVMLLFLRTLLIKPHVGRHVKKWIGSSPNRVIIEMKPLGEGSLDLFYFLVFYLLGHKDKYYKKWYYIIGCGS